MSRKQWIYASVFLVAAGALVVDRLFLGTPQQAAATPLPAEATPKRTVDKREGARPLSDPSLGWLDKLPEAQAGRDIFAPPIEWVVSRRERDLEAQARGNPGPVAGSKELFESTHQLQGTTVMSNGGVAVVDGQCLSVGDMLDNFQLVRVRAGEAEFRAGEARAVLKLPMAPAISALRTQGSTLVAPPPARAAAPTTRPSKRSGLLDLFFGGNADPAAR